MSKIEWTGKTWNPIAGCDIVSPGCTNCYAMNTAARNIKMNPDLAHYQGLTKKVNGKNVWTGLVNRAPDHILSEPLRRKKPTLWFVNSMSDLFHESVPDEWIDQIFAVMALTPQHTYQVLTKRPEWMRDYMTHAQYRIGQVAFLNALRIEKINAEKYRHSKDRPWPLPNVWLGVSVERQKEADERIPYLLDTPAAVRFLSVEPLIGHIDLRDICGGGIQSINAFNGESTNPDFSFHCGIDWVIVGGESGADARPMHPDWARSIRDQCAAADVAFFFKQWGACAPLETDADWDKHGTKTAHHDRHHDFNYARVGKPAAGRLLDGVEHNGMPAAREVPFQ